MVLYLELVFPKDLEYEYEYYHEYEGAVLKILALFYRYSIVNEE